MRVDEQGGEEGRRGGGQEGRRAGGQEGRRAGGEEGRRGGGPARQVGASVCRYGRLPHVAEKCRASIFIPLVWQSACTDVS